MNTGEASGFLEVHVLRLGVRNSAQQLNLSMRLLLFRVALRSKRISIVAAVAVIEISLRRDSRVHSNPVAMVPLVVEVMRNACF